MLSELDFGADRMCSRFHIRKRRKELPAIPSHLGVSFVSWLVLLVSEARDEDCEFLTPSSTIQIKVSVQVESEKPSMPRRAQLD